MSDLPHPPFEVALIGAGSVGTGVARLSRRAGDRVVGVSSRTLASAERAASLVGTAACDLGSLPPADVYLVGTGLDAVEEVASALARAHDMAGKVVIHFAGAAGVTPLGPAAQAGSTCCALHPVQACPDGDAAVRNLPGSVWGVTANEDARAWAHNWVERLEGSGVDVAEEHRPLWHSAAVITSNGIAALMAGGETILQKLGVEEPARVLAPLAAGTLANARSGGGGAATLTGPVVRGEVDVVSMHAAALRETPELAEIYRSISRVIADVALTAGRLDEAGYGELMDALEAR